MATFATVEDLLDAGDTELGTTDWHMITQEAVQQFAEATVAHEWIHVDQERAAREGPFATTVAHGYLTLSLATCFLSQLVVIEQDAVGVNYGLDRVRFPAPVPVGQRVRAHGRLKSAERVGQGVRTVVELTYETDGADKPPCVADVVSLAIAQ